MQNRSMDILIGPFAQIVTMAGLPLHGPLSDAQLEIVPEGGVVVSGGVIEALGNYTQLSNTYPHARKEMMAEPAVLLPGFIDCHTHICFAGTRAGEYAQKVAGATYLDIAKAGGGIWSTVTQTRAAGFNVLVQQLQQRVRRHFNDGVTTIEIKSGYGLSVADELKMLSAIAEAGKNSPASFISTCLAAHTLPRDFEGDHHAFLEKMRQELLPEVLDKKLSNRVDIFVEESAFSIADAREYLLEAKKMGFQITVHADQFTPGSAKLAAELGAASADHLEASGTDDIAAMAQSETVAVVLPGASLGLGMHFAPARKLLDAGCSLAIASDWNPGSAPMGDLLLQAAVLGAYEKLSFAETLAGITTRAAYALRLHDRGQLKPGLLAHMAAFATPDYREIIYRQGKLKPVKVWGTALSP